MKKGMQSAMKAGAKGTVKAAEKVATSPTAKRAGAKVAKAGAKGAVQAAPADMRVKAEAGKAKGVPIVHIVSTCSNVYVDAVVQGKQPAATLDRDIARILNAVYTRARHFGLSSCTAR